MAKRACPHCREKVQEKAAICKHCRSQLPPLPAKEWYQTWPGFLVIFFILAVLSNAFKQETPSAQSPTVEPKETLTLSAAEQSAAEDAGVRLLAMAERGILRFDQSLIEKSYVFIFVEPKYRSVMTHQQKEIMCELSGAYFRAFAYKKGVHPPSIGTWWHCLDSTWIVKSGKSAA